MTESATRAATVALLALLAVLLAGCDLGWLGAEDDDPPLPGQRLSILRLERSLEPDPDIANQDVRLPPPLANVAWPQSGGIPSHAMHHLAVGNALNEIWRRDVGSGETSDNLILTGPVVADGRVFVLDAESTITAFDLDEGRSLWEIDLIPETEETESSLGGGVAYDEGKLFVATAYGEVLSIDPKTGAISWRVTVNAPIRSAPTVAGGHLFAVTFDNQLIAIDTADGAVMWSHTGITESAGVLGAAAPAVSGDVVIAPFSSGELFALDITSGRVLWSDSLIFQGRQTTITVLSDIDASPVIDRGVVIAASQGGRLVALDLRSGQRLWEQEIASSDTPWIAGDFLYVLTSDGDVVCLRRDDGRIRWVTSLDGWGVAGEIATVWSGPILAGDRLVVVGSQGESLAVSPYSGKVLGRFDLPDGVRVAPVVAGKTLYILTVEAELVALR